MTLLQSNEFYKVNYSKAYQEGFDNAHGESPYPFPKDATCVEEEYGMGLAFRIGQCDMIVEELLKGKKTVHGTGHRHSRFADKRLIPKKKTYDESQKFYRDCILRTEALVDYLLSIGVRGFISGGAIGFDTWFGECINDIMRQEKYMANVKGESYPIDATEIVHIVAVPCHKQYSKWPPKAQARYKALCEEATFVYYCDRRTYSHECMQARNVWMTDHSQYTATCFMMQCYQGGTYNNLVYDLEQGLEIIGFDPSTWSTFTSSSSNFYLKGYVPPFEYIEDGYYRERVGDIFEGDGEIKMNTTNAKGPMGRGIAASFRDHYKAWKLEEKYGKLCRAGDVRPGDVMYHQINATLIANCCVKDDWRQPAKVEWIEKCLQDLVDQIRRRKSRSVDLCWPGRKNGWIKDYETTVVPMMREYFAPLANELRCIITVWSFNQSG